LAKGGGVGLLKWTNKGQLTENTVYTFTWGIVGKIPWYAAPDAYALSSHLYRLVRNHVTIHASVPDGYPRYSQQQDITLFQVRAPIYVLDPDRIIHVEEVIQLSEKTMQALRTFHLMKPAEYFMPPSGPLAGQILRLPGAFVAPMNSKDAVKDPTGVPGPKSQFANLWERLGFEEVFAPVKTVVKWGLAGVAGYGVYRLYKGIEAVPLPVKKEG